ncbi:MAG: hypothetical protein MUC50_11635 [Myxococcota bacterium]|jgi:hypothetical protein|nr:hypothetical protein [Myxococcota bacterium]
MMHKHDEELLRLAGDVLRQPDLLDDPRLDALARGELSQEEVEELLAMERAGELQGGATEAFSAFSEGYLARLEQSMAGDGTAKNDELSGRAKDAPVVTLSSAPRWKRSFVVGAPIVAAAAAVIALALWPVSPSGPRLPGYTLELEGGLAKVRAVATPTADEPVRLSANTTLQLRLRPATRTSEPVFVRLIAAGSEAASQRVVDPVVEVSESGTVTVRLSGEQLAPSQAARQRLHVLLAPASMKDQLPRHVGDLARLPVQVQTFAVEVILEN